MKLQTKTINIENIHPNDYNPNKMTQSQYEALRKNILDHGYLMPIIVTPMDTNISQYVIIDGEHRYQALKNLNAEFPKKGYNEVDCIIPDKDLSERQLQLLTLAMNNIHGYNNKDDLLRVIENIELEITPIEIQGLLPNLDIDELKEINVEIKDIDDRHEKIRPYNKTHILLSFPPEKIIEIEKYINEIIKINGVEYEQSAN